MVEKKIGDKKTNNKETTEKRTDINKHAEKKPGKTDKKHAEKKPGKTDKKGAEKKPGKTDKKHVSDSFLSRESILLKSPPPDNRIKTIFDSVSEHFETFDKKILEDAFVVSRELHEGQKRRSGEPFFIHPLAVAKIIADLGLTTDVVVAGLLHDTVEDTDYTIEQLEIDFGHNIAVMVDGVTKLDSLKYGKEAEAKTVRKMVVAMSQDIRVLVVKLCDRLHNARTWKYMPIPNAQRKAKQTLEIYAPLANRLGLGAIKLELENLSFATLEPKIYNEIVQLIAQRDQERKAYVDKVLQEINDELEKFNIKADVSGRPKHYYSIYRKMVIKGHEFKDIYDLTGVRIITNSVRDCYAALGAVHAMWPPVPGRFKDYIALPKYNMYQSLHTSVYGPEGRPVEFQIRTQEMHRHAEYGVAAHWKYKEKGVATKANKEENSLLDMRWLKQLTEWQEEEKDSAEFLESLRFDLGTKEVYVFTPQGAVKNLPAGSTPVDFAYSVHTDVGKKTMGARVNGKLVTLDTELKNGDTVEIITSRLPDAGPSRGWLDFVKSNRAKTKIRQYFTKGRREESIEQGKDMLAKAARKKNLPLQRLITKETLQAVVSFLNIKDIDTLYMSIGEHQISTEKVLARIISQAGEDEIVEESDPIVANKKPQLSKKNSSSSGVVVKGVDDVWVKLARCCMPVPGDEIVGFITRGHGVSVHQVNCKNLMQLIKNEPERKVEAKWADSIHEVYFVQVGIEALDRINLLTDISRLVSEHKMSITSLNSSYKENRTIMFRIGFEIGGPKQLEIIIRELQKIDGVFDVYRLNQG